jgi:hypothetical protein
MGVRARARVQGTYDEGAPCGDDEDNIRYDEHDEQEAGRLYAYRRSGGGTAPPGKEDVAGTMRKYCEDDVEEDDANEEGEEEAGKEVNRECDNNVDGFEALFKSLLSLPLPRLDACQWLRYGSPFSPSLSLPSPTSLLLTPGLLMPALLEPESLYALMSPTMSYSSSSVSHDTSAPTTPVILMATTHLRPPHAHATLVRARISAPSPPPSLRTRRSRSPSPYLFCSHLPHAARRVQAGPQMQLQPLLQQPHIPQPPGIWPCSWGPIWQTTQHWRTRV